MAEGRCCHDPMGNTHWKGEPSDCCHVHIENMPSNQAQRGEVEEMAAGWTAQAQHSLDTMKTRLAALEQEDENEAVDEEPVLHRHTSEGV